MLNELWPVVFFHKYVHFIDTFKMITPQLYLVYDSHFHPSQTPASPADTSLSASPRCRSELRGKCLFQPVVGAFSSNPLVVSSARTLVHLLIIALITYSLPLVDL